MKYLITESQLDKAKSVINNLMISELNNILDYDRTSDSDFINIYSQERGPDFFILMEFDHSDHPCIHLIKNNQVNSFLIGLVKYLMLMLCFLNINI
jgi:hypothetical protein